MFLQIFIRGENNSSASYFLEAYLNEWLLTFYFNSVPKKKQDFFGSFVKNKEADVYEIGFVECETL